MTAYDIYLSDKYCKCPNPATRTEGITIDDSDLQLSICVACSGMTEILETGYVYDWSEDYLSENLETETKRLKPENN